ncbi:hypothetical protein Bca4012_015021 [Brassica carinata]
MDIFSAMAATKQGDIVITASILTESSVPQSLTYIGVSTRGDISLALLTRVATTTRHSVSCKLVLLSLWRHE